MEGTVKWYSEMKSYGFIEVDDDKDVFVHQNGIVSGTTLCEGDNVEFDIEESPKGRQATNVKKL